MKQAGHLKINKIYDKFIFECSKKKYKMNAKQPNALHNLNFNRIKFNTVIK